LVPFNSGSLGLFIIFFSCLSSSVRSSILHISSEVDWISCLELRRRTLCSVPFLAHIIANWMISAHGGSSGWLVESTCTDCELEIPDVPAAYHWFAELLATSCAVEYHHTFKEKLKGGFTWHPISAKVGNHFADKWRSLGRCSSLADSDCGFFNGILEYFCCTINNIAELCLYSTLAYSHTAAITECF
jgi:hypothetical protein